MLHDVSLQIPPRAVTAFIGPSGCGKTTLLRCLNRMNDLVESAKISARLDRDPGSRYQCASVDVVDLRRRVGMVFQKSNPFPKSIYDNIAYGLRIAGVTKRSKIDEAVEKSLRAAALWDEVKDRLRRQRLRTFRRPAAAALHRARARRRARDRAHGRALFRARSDRDCESRRTDPDT